MNNSNQKYQIDWRNRWPELQVNAEKASRLDDAFRQFERWNQTLDDDQKAQSSVRHIAEVITIILKEFGLSYQSVMAIVLWQPVAYGILSKDDLADGFEEAVVDLVLGFIRIDRIDTSKTSMQTENFIRLIISLSKDVRLVLLRLAERINLIRNVKSVDEKERIRLCREGSVLYGPIAHRLGLYRIKTEFEESGMKFLHPEEYQYIARRLNETKSSRESYIHTFIEPLESLLKKRGIRCEVKGRPKSIHSIWKKMKGQGVDFDEVYDLFAIRIILDGHYDNEKSECWQVYSIVTDQYQPNPNRLRDWISVPKPNGYESLHTTVIGPDGKWVEVQIRTRRMDQVAEMGQAAHWMYKENKEGQEGLDWLERLRLALTAPEEAEEISFSEAKNELYSDQIYIFTPQNDLIKLKSGSTVLDFAFAVHTKVGYHCTGAKVNGRICPIKHILTNGDQVEILTSPQQKPKTDWLNIVKSSKARGRIKRVLKEADYDKSEEGKDTLRRKFEQWKIKYDVTTVHRLVNHLKMKDALDLYQAMAENKVDLQAMRDFLKEKDPAGYLREKPVAERSIENFVKNAITSDDCLIIDEHLDNVDYKLAKCCNPIFGDEVFGFVTVKEGTKIHRINCPNARQLIQRYPYRVLKVRWTDHHADTSQFTVNITITGIDDIGILNEISKVISGDLRVNMRAMNVETKDGFFYGKITLIVNDKHHLGVVITKVKQVKGVLNVQRSDV